MSDRQSGGGVGGGAGERAAERAAMVEAQLLQRDITDGQVLAAMRRVPRHRFVPANEQDIAYADEPLPIGHGQTISQPYIVALMTQLLGPRKGDRVLEIGTGCGYQTAVLASLVAVVCTVEIVSELAAQACATLRGLGVGNVVYWVGDGRLGWPERAPFDGIVVTAAPEAIEAAWVAQLGEGGRIVVPVGDRHVQWLHRLTKRRGTVHDERLIPVRFVPLVGTATGPE